MNEQQPLITERGQSLLDWIREHPAAPHWRHRTGDRLTAAGREAVQAFAQEIATGTPGWSLSKPPDWLDEEVARCLDDVPMYRRHHVGARSPFAAIPTVSRDDLAHEPWAFVPDSADIGELIGYATSGTTGRPVDILSTPTTSSMFLPLLQRALETRGVALQAGDDGVAIVRLEYHASTYTYCALSGYLGNAGFARVNLFPTEWRDPEERSAFLDAMDPQIYTGNPISLSELALLPLKTRPRAIISSSMMLSDGLRTRLEEHFACPVVDVYATGEAGPTAVGLAGGEFQLLQPRLFVEILNPDGTQVEPGDVGEVTVTGGFNPLIALLRYRTGDYAAIQPGSDGVTLTNFAGRTPVLFVSSDGLRINSLDICKALRPFAFTQHKVHQSSDGTVLFDIWGGDKSDQLGGQQALIGILGADAAITVAVHAANAAAGQKVVPYTSDITLD